MSERWSKLLVAVEALVLFVPVTLLAALSILGAIAFVLAAHMEPYEQAQAIVYLIPVVPLIAGWMLIGRFLASGRAGLRSCGALLWWLAALGGAIVLAAICVGSSFDKHELEYEPTLGRWVLLYFRELAFGLPALVPLVHLAIERRRQMSSNYRLERP
jgi:general stress protein CsbA